MNMSVLAISIADSETDVSAQIIEFHRREAEIIVIARALREAKESKMSSIPTAV